MAAEVEIRDDVFSARFRPERSAAIAGLGCASVLSLLTLFGVYEAITTSSLTAVLGLPCTGIFAVAFAMVGLTRGRVTVNRLKQQVISERRFLGWTVRRDILNYGKPRKVTVDILGRERRPFRMISIDGERRHAEVLTDYNPDDARAFAKKLANYLGVFVEERPEDGGKIYPLPEPTQVH